LTSVITETTKESRSEPKPPQRNAAVTRPAWDAWALDQENVAAICAERDLVSPEIHRHNDFYGQASVLKRYAELPEERSLRFVVEHGIHVDDLVWQVDVDAPLGTIAACSPWRAEILREKSGKRTETIGFGYLYAQGLVERLYGPGPATDERRGTLAFPCHSTQVIRARFDHADYAQRLVSLPAEMQPAVVCAYWKDFRDGAMEPYVAAGLRIVSCGHMFDRDFLLRLHDLSRRFRFAVSNALGSHLFLSAASGCRFAYLESSPVEFDIPDFELENCGQFRPMFRAAEAESRRLFGEVDPAGPVPDDTTEAQRAFVDRYVGTAHYRSPAELRRVIARVRRADRFVPARILTDTGHRVIAPPAVARRMGKPIRKLEKWGRSIRKRLPGGRRAA